MRYISILIIITIIQFNTYSQTENKFIKIKGEIVDNISEVKVPNTKVKVSSSHGKIITTESNKNGEFKLDSLIKGESFVIEFKKTAFFYNNLYLKAIKDTVLFIVMDKLPINISYLPIVFFDFNKTQLLDSYKDSLKGIKDLNSANLNFKILGFRDIHEKRGTDSLRAISFARMLIEIGLDSTKITTIKASDKPNYVRTNECIINNITGEYIDGPILSEANIWRLRNYVKDIEELRRWNRAAIIEIDEK